MLVAGSKAAEALAVGADKIYSLINDTDFRNLVLAEKTLASDVKDINEEL